MRHDDGTLPVGQTLQQRRAGLVPGVLHRDALSNVERARLHFRRYLEVAPEGPHAEEARSSLPPEEGGLPVRVERAEIEANDEEGEPEAGQPEGGEG